MKTTTRLTAGAVCLAIAVCCAVACGKRPERAPGPPIRRPSPPSAEVHVVRDKVAETGKIDTVVSLPENLPADVPIYAGAAIRQSATIDDGAMFIVALRTADSFDSVTGFYKDRCTAEGWIEVGAVENPSGTSMQALTYMKDNRTLSVNIVDNPEDNVRDIALTVSTQ